MVSFVTSSEKLIHTVNQQRRILLLIAPTTALTIAALSAVDAPSMRLLVWVMTFWTFVMATRVSTPPGSFLAVEAIGSGVADSLYESTFRLMLQNSPYLAYSNSEIFHSYLYSATPKIQSGGSLDLSDAAQVESIIQQSVANVKKIDTNLNTEQLSQIAPEAAKVMAEANQSTDKVKSNFLPEFIPSEIAKVQKVTLDLLRKSQALSNLVFKESS